MNTDDKNNTECDNHISERDFLRSISYHESGHTAAAYITKRQIFQIIDHPIIRVWGKGGWAPINFFSQFIWGEMTINEKIFYGLAGLASQDILESKKEHKLGVKLLKEHWEGGIQQGDIKYVLKKTGKKYKKLFEQDCSNKEMYIDFCIQKIRNFISKEPRMKKFIARLAYMNQRQKLLLPEHINEAAKYAGIDESERNRLRVAINELDLLKFTGSPFPLSSAE